MTNWDHIKPGDEIGVVSRTQAAIVCVNRVTATQIVVNGDLRFSKKTDRRVGDDGYDTKYIVSAEKCREIIADRTKLARQETLNRIESMIVRDYKVKKAEVPAFLRRAADDLENRQ